eukprot:scaffold93291_cov29-Tisochrysis_lutea.AAC.7
MGVMVKWGDRPSGSEPGGHQRRFVARLAPSGCHLVFRSEHLAELWDHDVATQTGQLSVVAQGIEGLNCCGRRGRI